MDFTNPATVAWRQETIGGLLKMGVGAIKAARGFAARLLHGFYEHNLYPLRYNKAVHDITKDVTGEDIMRARSAWTGSQRYPLRLYLQAARPVERSG